MGEESGAVAFADLAPPASVPAAGGVPYDGDDVTSWAVGASVVFSVILSVILAALVGVLVRRRFDHIAPVPDTNVRKVLPAIVSSAIAFSGVFLVVALLIHHAR